MLKIETYFTIKQLDFLERPKKQTKHKITMAYMNEQFMIMVNPFKCEQKFYPGRWVDLKKEVNYYMSNF